MGQIEKPWKRGTCGRKRPNSQKCRTSSERIRAVQFNHAVVNIEAVSIELSGYFLFRKSLQFDAPHRHRVCTESSKASNL